MSLQTYQPTAVDNALILELRHVMSRIYNTERGLCEKFRETLQKYYQEIQLHAAEIGSTRYTSDGHVQQNVFIHTISEGKFLGKGEGDPEVEACGYFIESLRHLHREEKIHFPDTFPSIIIYFIGEVINVPPLHS